jgi:hypothetical protein
VEALINQLYSIFARYTRPHDFPACDCCMSADEKSVMLTKPIRQLTADELGQYAADAFLTVGELPDFKYFLPRILELAVRSEFVWPDPEVVMGKLPLAQWYEWPTEEQVIVSELLKAKLAALLDDPDSRGSEIDGWVCALGRCLPDPIPFLELFLEPPHQDKLRAFVEHNESLFTKNMLDNPFWSDARENEQRVVRWLNEPAVRAVLSGRYGMVF